MPIIIAALILNSLLLVDQELIIPRMIPKLTREHGDIHQAATNYYESRRCRTADGGLLYASRYYPAPTDSQPKIEELTVIQAARPPTPTSISLGNKLRNRCWFRMR